MTKKLLISLRLHGGFSASSDGTEIEGISARGQFILAYLALRPDQRASREELAALIWDERAEDQARASLRQELSLLRKALPEGMFVADRRNIALSVPDIDIQAPATAAWYCQVIDVRL